MTSNERILQPFTLPNGTELKNRLLMAPMTTCTGYFAAACGLMKQAGQIAARQGGPGSFIPAFLDALYQEVQG